MKTKLENSQKPAAKPRSLLQNVLWSNTGMTAFIPEKSAVNPRVESVISNSIAALIAMKTAGTAYNELGKISDHSLMTLAKTGWWGIGVPLEYGGSGATCFEFMDGVSRMAAAGFMTEAGLNGINFDLGAPYKLIYHGSDAQKAYFLPQLASGERLSALAATEPCAGTNLAAIETEARRDGDDYVINGSKLFIGNAWPTELIGRTIALLARVPEEGPDSYAVFVVEVTHDMISVVPNGTAIPADAKSYVVVPHGKDGSHGIHAILQARNTGLEFRNLRVPAFNRIEGNGLKHTYEGLNPGRICVLANAAGAMRWMLRLITPAGWGQYRETFGKPIEERELIKARVARLAALIVGADAVRNFCARQLDSGDRFGLPCIIAKIFGSEAVSEAGIDLGLMTAGGRGLLKGHPIGDNIHEFLAGRIYDGQNDMLRQKFLAELLGPHLELLKPMGDDLKALSKGKLAGLKLAKSGLAYALWKAVTTAHGFNPGKPLPQVHPSLQKHVDFALAMFPKLALEISAKMLKHGAKLPERQNLLVRLSQRLQDSFIMLITALHGNASNDEATMAGADLLCQDLRRKLTGEFPDEAYDRACVRLADMVTAGKFTELEGAMETPIFRPYAKKVS